ncbi:MAG TPA: hypothetical protein VIO11_06000 [Candidatus Methanoperedens sp.]
MATDIEIVGLFIATWAMMIPLYYQLGEIKKSIGCPLCKKIIAEKDLKEANSELKMKDTKIEHKHGGA